MADPVRTHYDKSAHHARPPETAGFRAACNAAKDVWLRQLLSPGRWNVLDVGCGRGGDIGKCIHLAREFGARVDSYVGMDVSAGALEEAFGRLEPMQRELRFDLFLCDAGSARWDCPNESQGLILSHFSAHYWADTPMRWNHFWMEATRVARRGAVMSVAVIAWSVLARLARDRALTTFDSCVQVEICNPASWPDHPTGTWKRSRSIAMQRRFAASFGIG